MDSLPLLLAGMATSTNCRGESESQKAITGTLTNDDSRTACESVRGSVMMSRRGSRNCLVIWLVNVPGVKRLAIAWQPVCWANLSTARWPYGRAEMAITSSGFSTATITRAASMSFSHVLPTLMMWMPSLRRRQM
ncbi:hypothetical protein F441_22214 [Phytophthora nicotianae CJ01A1]|uniref:Uncharacterized protein n=3 Tax=Phytophthora nicotianae TaxID=4792 RepID=V9DVA4_PHYNI|nr:hypothetical protein F443_22308 [Phytophthora nicotianae P1569]ETP00367.1 hypothetical protein F441_22214 [Phytophthora nicotianae CJ01A1]ETP28519.1 hypothetical protein F442_22189 [Phytophthora nicotianae P10297]